MTKPRTPPATAPQDDVDRLRFAKASDLLSMLDPDKSPRSIPRAARSHFVEAVKAEIDRRFPVVPVPSVVNGHGAEPPPVVLDIDRLDEIVHTLTSGGGYVHGVTAAEVTAMALEIAKHRGVQLRIPPTPSAESAFDDGDEEHGRAGMGDDW